MQGTHVVLKPAEVATVAQAEAPAVEVERAGLAIDTERILAELLADVVQVDTVPVDSNFFDDLGADSMVMARFCARVRKRADLPSVSMKDIYRHPTISSLAGALAGVAPSTLSTTPLAQAEQVPAATPPGEVPRRASTPAYLLCGTLQLLIFFGYSYLLTVIVVRGYQWISAGAGNLEIYLRTVAIGT